MLTELYIKNFAIIDNLHVSFRSGLNILTGETGAGKSIIIDAVDLVLGGRGSADIIRTGEEEATVEALFDLDGLPEIRALLFGSGVECDEELLIKRTVSRSGRNRAFVGGGLYTVSALADLAGHLISIYGQHESQALLKPDFHLRLLDEFGGIAPIREEFATIFETYRKTSARLRQMEEGDRDAARKIDLLSFQSGEIAKAALSPGEEEDLARERELLVHGERLQKNSSEAYDLLYGGDSALIGMLSRAISCIEGITGIDPALSPTVESLKSAQIQLEDTALALRDYSSRIESDPRRLQTVDERLDQINRLKKKYKPGIADILAYKEEIDQELAVLIQIDTTRGELDLELKTLATLIAEKGERLSEGRKNAARSLKPAMEEELHQLAMKNARFEVAFEKVAEPKATGLEKIEFLFSPNPGEEPKPLARIASGGELSRLMLALKQIHPESDVPTLVFDEVDAGIGGATSALVGEKLKRVACCQQVLCITHLPQVAAYADHHFRVEKKLVNNRTMTTVTPLDGEERVAEIARMLGGVKISEKTLAHAREMVYDTKG